MQTILKDNYTLNDLKWFVECNLAEDLQDRKERLIHLCILENGIENALSCESAINDNSQVYYEVYEKYLTYLKTELYEELDQLNELIEARLTQEPTPQELARIKEIKGSLK